MEKRFMDLTRALHEAEAATKSFALDAQEEYDLEYFDYTGISEIRRVEDKLAHSLMNSPKGSVEIQEAEEELRSIVYSYAESDAESLTEENEGIKTRLKVTVTWNYANKHGEISCDFVDKYYCDTTDEEEAKKIVLSKLNHPRIKKAEFIFKKVY